MEINKTNCLSKEEYQEVVALLKTCERHDSFEIGACLNLSMIQKGDDKHLDFILAREKEDLVGFLGLYSFVDPKKVELAGMIHPAYRNQGKFSRLLEHAKQITRARDANEVIFVCPLKSDAAIHLSSKMDATYMYTEFTMEYNMISRKKDDWPVNMSINKADLSDSGMIMKLFSEGFEVASSDENIKRLIESNLTKLGYELFLVRLDKNPIATITISDEEQSVYLSAFTVTPAQRGKGYGRIILERIINDIIVRYPKKSIRLDVDVKNEGAIRLYENIGFRIVDGFDYYLAK
ncbi:GNAT family N-acetyltransferase [Sutcliffiella horikoshii]|uniref:GNAT family N-acetyltransferase n=1 Tax=Sutcliffiella horikoshii TaxID=79883 RepID=A0A5D4SRZ0_9BACI|nr:GNAT family N-acetyltransferase [Sutcliffiella horikoshii]TYS65769.1 GNAT family N-acetyltransferase [Sutcliffiella horikoshii]